uniref:Probable arginine--tRNA ligase, mitochondrial n=1 Tax=Mesocestoides corti TaxID=53468 RepID=A0A5K3EJ53_MESCO
MFATTSPLSDCFFSNFVKVDDGQREHFSNLAHLLSTLGYEWAKPGTSPWPLHVRFAKVAGASSRRGSGLFLVDVLDSARREARRRMLQSPCTRVDPSDPAFDVVADQMGVTWLVAEMLRKPRLQPVQLQIRLDGVSQTGHSGSHSLVDSRDLTGLGLQYCHARLCSLEQKAIARGLLGGNGDADEENARLVHSFYEIPSNRPSREVEEEVCAHLATFPEVLTHAYVKYEADGLLRYCSHLTGLVNRAWRFLPVLTAESENLALSRIAIFKMARNTLATCLAIIGAKPLSKL